MERPLVGVVLGSRSDFNVMRRGLETLRVMGVPYLLELASPHRTPERVARFAATAGERGFEVLIAAAGGNGQLPATIACYTNLPVIGVPLDSTPLRGEDALTGMVQMPPGTPVATVGINAAENAALLATQILALKHARFREVLAHRRMAAGQKLERFLTELVKDYPDLCDPAHTVPKRRHPLSDVETDPGPGSEDSTPEPPDEPERTERIRPGAVLASPRPIVAHPGDANRLVQTPMPQEPGVPTPDSSEDTPPADELRRATIPQTPAAMPTVPAAPRAVAIGSGDTPTPAAVVPSTMRVAANGTATAPPPPQEVPVTPDLAPLASAIEEDTAPLLETRLFRVDPQNPDVNVLEHAMLVLLEGGMIAVPTDTVYGLAADATNPEAVRRLLEIKGQDPSRKSIAVLIGDASWLDNLVTEVPSALERVIDEFWPGGLTILFNRRPTVLPNVSDAPSIGVRIPADPVSLQLLLMMSRPLAVINTAHRGGAPATTAEEVLERFSGRVDCVLDAGPCKAGAASTVLSALIEPFEVLREGAVKHAELKRVLGDKMR